MEIWVDMLRKEGGIQKLVTHTRSYPLFLKPCPFPFLSSNIPYAFKMAGRPTSRDPPGDWANYREGSKRNIYLSLAG